MKSDKNCKVSIIVPVYNMEKYLKRCMDSLLGQTYKNMEIILADDGSEDASGRICDSYQEHYETLVRTVHSSHQGVTNARLLGLKKASGEYIAFVDADDWIERDYISSMVRTMEDADIVAAGISRDPAKKGNGICEYNDIPAGRYTSELERAELYERMLYSGEPYRFGVLPYMCNKLFKKNLILSLMEKQDKRIFDGEDAAVIYPCLLHAQRIMLTDDCGYHYVVRKDSASLSDPEEAYLNVSCLYQTLYEYFSGSRYRDNLLVQLDQYIRRMVWKKDPAAALKANSFWFPFRRIEPGARIILYGMGKMGRAFYVQLRKTGYCEIVAWADRDPDRFADRDSYVLKIFPGEIREQIFDHVVIAVLNRDTACEIFNSLCSMGIEQEKIIAACL